MALRPPAVSAAIAAPAMARETVLVLVDACQKSNNKHKTSPLSFQIVKAPEMTKQLKSHASFIKQRNLTMPRE